MSGDTQPTEPLPDRQAEWVLATPAGAPPRKRRRRWGWIIALLVAVALLWPGRPGPVARWVLGALAVLVPAGNVTWYAHRPADVLGSVLLVASVTALAWAAFLPDLTPWWRPARAVVSRGG